MVEEAANNKEVFSLFLKNLKSKKVESNDYDVTVTMLQNEATERGLDDDILEQLTDVIKHVDLSASKQVNLIKCLIPKTKLSEEILKSIMSWCLAKIKKLPITVSTIVIQWIIGLWDYKLADRKVINIFYDVLFYAMFKKERLACYIARLIYELTKPQDVFRPNVLRLLNLQKNYSKPPRHIIALLSLFKSYKPELVPEKIASVNMESVWKPIPESLHLSFAKARDRAEVQQSPQSIQGNFVYNVVQIKKTRRLKAKVAILPSISYFHIGSSIFREKDGKTIFDISNIEELGKYHHRVELPCNAVSLLGNIAGYHLLAFADFEYQTRFSYNLYNTLIRAFIIENEKFSEEEKDKLLTMTIEFSRYIQEEIPVIKLFFNEYLYYNTGEHLPKLLNLVEWMTSISVADLREYILVHIQNIFYESDLDMKCQVIKSLRKLIINLFVKRGFGKDWQNTSSLFLQQGPSESLIDIIPVLTTVSEDLIIFGLNVHNYNIILLSEALTFYETICILERRSQISFWTMAPSAVVYGAFVTESCALLLRICKLLLSYRAMCPQLQQILPAELYEERILDISVYANNIHKALWLDKPFSARENSNFLRNLSKEVINDLTDCDLDSLLNISCHYAILPYKCTLNYMLNKAGLHISTKEDAMSMSLHYYPEVNEFIAAFHE